MPQLLVLGDDLTGSNASGALNARLGLRAVSVTASLEPDAPCFRADSGIDALAVNLGTRHASPSHAERAVRRAIELTGPVELTVKRVDTTLRGNVGVETEAESPAARDPLAPVASSRVRTLLGPTRCELSELPLDVVEEGVDAVEAALRCPAGLVVCDATTNRHLTTVAKAAARLAAEGTKWISVDSGPFGVRLAAAPGLAPGHGTVPPVLAVIGGITGQTHDQLLETELVPDARYVDVEAGRPDPPAVAAAAGQLLAAGHRVAGIRTRAPATGTRADPAVAARIPPALGEAARPVPGAHRIGGLYASGGDIAVAVTKSPGAEGFEIDTEVLPPAVAGRLSGGPHAGLPFATKGGLTGGRDAAVACPEHLNHVLATGRNNP
ncbi:four-carbon acid sugar kinase family protein [Amycolatopsis sp. FBCC-B4732]|uniref:four-carbon acid sugar kinase family protein n=1 Tax=Amycolatopsis sp. FBCC-B4732 TaxID=3079339 RepID=UPI001FF492DC|nr:four-carbon acid sugar kinase family protein [Amycolatopsis sp. FBCC-B4732]UOX85014.1 four-carbon acid sugar kinase family protein [Amycolatopsis sp. FBCC-B4732]